MYESNQRIDWYRVNVPPDLMRRISRPNDLKGMVQAGGHLGLVALTGMAAFYVSRNCAWYWLIPAFFLHGTMVTNLAAGVHELVHERVFKTRWLNRFFMYLLSFLTWWNPRFFLLSHNEHHKYTLHQPDDLEVVLPMHLTVSRVVRAFLIDPVALYRTIRQQVRYVRKRYVGDWEDRVLGQADARIQRRVGNWSLVLLVGHGLIAAISLFYGLWIIPILVSCGAFYAGGLAFLMHSSQHIGLVDQINDFRLCCRTIQLNPVFQYLYWRMNFHTEHHMYPVVPCYSLPALYEVTKHEMPRPRKGLYEAWVEIAHILIRQRHEPTYEYRVPLPTDSVESEPPQAEDSCRKKLTRVTATVWECRLCGFIYDELKGLLEEGIAPGTRWEDIPDDWRCPVCGVSKSHFQMVEIAREAAE